jgi:deoxycytidine triphosphate deaminase
VPTILSGEEISLLIKQIDEVPSGEQKQPAGYDVTLSKLYSFSSSGYYTLGIEKTENSQLTEILADADGYFDLGRDSYLLELNEVTTIPPDAIGILLPRSTLLRNGLDVRSALFDPGYSGQPKILLVSYRKAKIKKYSRIGQLVIIRSDTPFRKQYAGRYQGERSG